MYRDPLQIMRRYYVSQTKTPHDYDYFDRFEGHDPRTDPCLGLFQRETGQFDMPFLGDDIVSIHRNQLHPLQQRYQIESGYDEDYLTCPTIESIVNGDIPLAFRVNHKEFNTTHTLRWIPHARDYPFSHWVLVGERQIPSRTEVTFNYKFGKVVYKF